MTDKKHPIRHIMLDLETMGNSSNAPVVAIGAVAFTQVEGIFDTFYVTVDLQTCLDAGMQPDGSTVMWWLQQSEAARKALFAPTQHPKMLIQALMEFERWAYNVEPDSKELRVWGNGASFDIPILENAFRVTGNTDFPWRHWNHRCYRTLAKLVPRDFCPKPEDMLSHHALEDARYQALRLLEIAADRNITLS